MADAKLSALTTASGLALTDLIYVVLDPSGTPVSRKSALSDILTLFLANTDADDIDDAGTTNKFATAAEKASSPTLPSPAPLISILSRPKSTTSPSREQ